MIFRRFVEALCYVSHEEITVKAALTLLSVAIGEDRVQTIFPNTDVEKLMKSYMRSERNLSKPVAKEIREAFNETPDNRKELKESLCEQCFCNKERIARTKEAFGQYCPDLLNMEKIKVLKKEGSELLVNLFIDMLKKAESGYREKPNFPSLQSETEPNGTSVPLQPTANSTNVVGVQNKSDIAAVYTISDDEKRAILNLCELINRTLQSTKQKTEAIDRKQHELEGVSADKSQQRWKEYLECDLKALKESFSKLYSELAHYCADLSILLESKQRVHPSFKAVYEIASQIDDEKYKITCPDSFRYSALVLAITNFQKNYERLKIDIPRL